MRMPFDAVNVTFRQLMGNGLSYQVPRYQRDYSWTESEWDDLWQDLIALFSEDAEPAHYLGYVVLQTSNNKDFHIIDGQQRLTTLSLLILSAIKTLLDLPGDELTTTQNRQRADQIRQSYIGYVDAVSLSTKCKLQLNRHNNDFYHNKLVPLQQLPQRNLNASEHLLRRAFEWFSKKTSRTVPR